MVWMSLHNWSIIEPKKWVGFANFVKAWNDRQFWVSLGFTLKYTLYITPILMILGYLIALLVAPNTPLRRFTRGVVFVPVVIGLSVSSLLWYWLFSYHFGLVNRGAHRSRHHRQADRLVRRGRRPRALGGDRLDRLEGGRLRHAPLRRGDPGDPAGDQRGDHGRRRELLAARPADHAAAHRAHVLLVTLFSVIGSLLAFDQFFLMTAGQPFNQTASSMFWVYLNSFPYLKLGYGAALSLILAAIVLACTVVQMMLTPPDARLMPLAMLQRSSADYVLQARPEARRDPQLVGARLGEPRKISGRRGLHRALRRDAGAARPVGDGVAEEHGRGRPRYRRPTSRTS